MQVQPGQKLGPYEVVAFLGEGGMGEVWSATDTRLGRRVAVKILSRHLVSHIDALERFEHEARVVAALSHPNVVTLYDVGREGALNFVVTELLEGETLRGLLGDPMPWRDAVEIISAACRGLDAAHARGIVHRDLKPENIFVTREKLVKILDFGLARFELPAQPSDATMLKTPGGIILGTVGYMSPEQVRGEPAGPGSDVFSMGCVLYEMLSGNRAFKAETAAETMHAILRQEPRPMRGKGRIPQELQAIVVRCLAKDPGRRYPSARELLDDLRLASPASPTVKASPLAVTKARARSMAILPFVNETGSTANDKLGDLIAETLIRRLSLAAGEKLRVIARSASFRFPRDIDPREAGQQLEVPIVVTGRLLQLGEKVSVVVEIVDVADATQLWGDRFRLREGDLEEAVEQLVDRILESLVEELELSPKRRARKTVNEASGESSVIVNSARAHADRGDSAALRKAVELVSDAIRRDPQSAAVHAQAVELQLRLALRGASPAESRDRAKQALRAAMAVDPASFATRVASALVKGFFDHRWDAAESELRAAIEGSPDCPERLWLARIVLVRKPQEAMEIARAAARSAPSSAWLASEAAFVFYMGRRFDEAIESALRSMILNSELTYGKSMLALAMGEKRLFDDAASELQRHADDEIETLAALGYIYAAWDKKAGARKALEKLDSIARRRYVSSWYAARIEARGGNVNGAFDRLQLALGEDSPLACFAGVDPAFDSLRPDPRFARVLQSLGL